MNKLLEAAKQYVHEYGFSVIPCKANDKKAVVKWEEFQKRKPTDEEIERWWKMWPDSNIAIVTGRISGICVIDVDGEKGRASYGKTLINKMPRTRVHATPHGHHLIFRYNPALKTGAAFLEGIDVRGDGGYIVAPPSVVDENEYTVLRDLDIAEVPEVPSELLPANRAKPNAPAQTAGQPGWVTEMLTNGAPQSQRNASAARLIGFFHSKGIERDIIVPMMEQFAERCNPPMDRAELRNTIQSVTRYQVMAKTERIEEPPLMTRDGESMIFTWEQQMVRVHLDNIRQTKDGIHAKLEVSTSVPHVGPHLHGPVNWGLFSTSARMSLVNYLKKRLEIDWASILEEAARLATRTFEEGEPLIFLSEYQAPNDPSYALYPMVVENEPVVLFGDGGTGKSYYAMSVAMALHTGEAFLPGAKPNLIHRGLYLDWETNAKAHQLRMQRLCNGIGWTGELPDIAYIRCHMPLSEHLREVKRHISRHSLGFVVIDSAAAACGGEAEKSEVALHFFNVLRSLNVTPLIIAHVTKAESKGKPFGSGFWHNMARATFEMILDEDSRGNEINVGVYQRKANDDSFCRPFGLRLNFGPTDAIYKAMDIQSVPALAQKTTVRQQIYSVLDRRSPMSVAALATELDLEAVNVRKTLNRHKDTVFIIVRKEGTSPLWGLLKGTV